MHILGPRALSICDRHAMRCCTVCVGVQHAVANAHRALLRSPLPLCRVWLDKVAGGGPWGPMDERYLLRAGRRLPEKQLLDHYHSHTERCSICRPALRNLRVARAAAAAVGIAAAAVAAVSLFVQYVAPAVAGTAAGAASAAAGQAAAHQAAAAAAAVSPAGWPPLVALAAACAAVAAVAGLVWRWCHKTIPQFYTGERPFARNRVPGEFAPQI